MRTQTTLMATAIALALGFSSQANAEDKPSGVDAKARATIEASLREQTALELRSGRSRGLARADFDARLAVEGELESEIDSEAEAEIGAEAEAEIEADVDTEI